MKKSLNTQKEYQRLEPFIDQYNQKDINFPTGSKDWKKLKTNKKTIALNVLFTTHIKEEIKQAYISKYKS